MLDIIRPIVAARRAQPQDDLTSILIEAEITDEDGRRQRLSDAEIYSFALLLLAAGWGTTGKQMGITLTALLQRPDVLCAVREDRALLRPAIEESPPRSRWCSDDEASTCGAVVMDQQPFDGVRVVELAQWVFVPVAGALLADWGADVIHLEPLSGDPYRGLMTQGIGADKGGVNLSMALANRGKRSLAIDVRQGDGRKVLDRLLDSADVFLTSLRPGALKRLELDEAALRERYPRLVYARGHGFGVRGPDANHAGYDASAFWARGGLAHMLTPGERPYPISQRGAMGDRNGAKFCQVIGREDLLDDPRFANLETRRQNSAACIAALDAEFARRTFEEWKQMLRGLDAPWAPVQAVGELVADPQVIANSYIGEVENDAGESYHLPNVPVQFDGRPAALRRAPEHGEHNEALLLELGYSWDEIAELHDAGAIP